MAGERKKAVALGVWACGVGQMDLWHQESGRGIGQMGMGHGAKGPSAGEGRVALSNGACGIGQGVCGLWHVAYCM